MNQLLLERSTGNLSPRDFARIQTSQRVHAIQLARRLRFDGGEKEHTSGHVSGELDAPEPQAKIWAHQAGVNALSVDIEDQMLVSGGADSTIKLWNIGNIPNAGIHNFKPIAAVAR